MEYQYVKAFLCVGKHLNFTRAAEELCVTQAAISRQIRLFEESIGEQLVLRSPQKVVLTKRGQQLYEILSSCHYQIQSDFLNKEKKVIRVGIIEGVLVHWFLDKVASLVKLYGYNVDIRIESSKDLVKQLNESQIDLFIGSENIQTGLLSSAKLFKEELVLVSKSRITKNQIEKHPWIVYSQSDPLMQRKKKSEQIITVNSIHSMIRLVDKGLGISILPAHSIPKESSFYVQKWSKASGYIYLTTQNFSQKPKWLQDVTSVL